MLAGDWLYMQAFKIAVQERNFAILDTLIELTQAMVEGELLQIERLGKAITLDEHFELIYRKTACLFSVCMKLGGILGGASEGDLQRLAEYGRNLGMAFQIVDDVLDLTASEEVLGKPVASDLREGKATMAVLHALERSSASERAMIVSVLSNGGFNGITPSDIVGILKRIAPSKRRTPARWSSPTKRARPSAPSRTPRSNACCCGWRSSWSNATAKETLLESLSGKSLLPKHRIYGRSEDRPFQKRA